MSDRKELSQLEGDGWIVHKFTDYHYRVASRFDVMPNDHGRKWAWHDLMTEERGYLPAGEFRSFIPEYFKRHPRPEPVETVAPATAKTGVWQCPLPGCTFELADDFSSVIAKQISEHLETHPDDEDETDQGLCPPR